MTLPRRAPLIYLILDAEGTPRYVGKSEYPARRLKQHQIQQHHYWAVSYLVIEAVQPGESWKAREAFWIAYYRQWYPLENISKGGVGSETYGVFYENREQITSLLKNTNESFRSIARRFGVSPELIRQIAQGLKLPAGVERRAARKYARLREAAIQQPLMARFIEQCKARNLQWELLPAAHDGAVPLSGLLVGGVTVKIAPAAKYSIPSGREYVRISRVISKEWDVVAYALPDNRWLILDHQNQIQSSATAFSLDPIANRGNKQSKHHWKQFIDAWHLLGPQNSARQEQNCA